LREPNPEFTPLLLQKLFTPGINVGKKKALHDLQVYETQLQFDTVPISQVRKTTLRENPSSVCKKFELSFLLQNDMFLIQFLYGFKNKTLCKKTLLFGVKRIHTLFLEAKISCCQKQARTQAKDGGIQASRDAGGIQARDGDGNFMLLEMEEFQQEMKIGNSGHRCSRIQDQDGELRPKIEEFRL
jgi:hypothetical protein